jgi:hypothetical protein
VLGRGTIVYDGPQDPNSDEGWMQKPDWHCIGSLESHNVEIDGLTCIMRSRTWSIQMKDSAGFTFDDLRVIGGNPGNANQDGMDWLGGGDTIVRNAFLRASDDVFAMEGNWDGYTDEPTCASRPRRAEHPRRAQRTLHQHLQHCARRLAAEDLQLAQLHPARLRHSPRRHRRMRPDLWPARLLGRKRRQGRPLQLHI